jgi:hypothetical protein
VTKKGYRRLLASASVLCFATGLVLLPTAAFATGKAGVNGQANGVDKKTTTTSTPTTTVAPTPTGTIAASNTSPTTLPPQPLGNNEVPGGPGANNQTGNQYASNGVGLPSGNGNGNGNATGKPCAGCVGNADNKNPPGQAVNGSDHNAGYECDRNHGIGRSNPAHTGCQSTTTTPTVPPTTPTVPPTTPTTLKHHDPTTTTQPSTSGSTTPTTACSSKNSGSSTSSGTSCITPATGAPGHGSSTTVAAAKPATATKSSGSLAFTGADVGSEFLAGGIALAAGALLLGSSRRRRSALAEPAEMDDESQD